MGLGQFSGSKKLVAYTSDTDEVYNMLMDEDLVQTGQGLPNATAGTGAPPPKRFKPRGVYWQATAAGFEGKRKFLVCGSPTAAFYDSDSRQAITVDGVAGITTGRRGEKLSL